MKDILKTLVEIPTVTKDVTANKQALEYIDRFLSERGMFVKRFSFNDVESLIATTHKTQKPKVFLAAHVDVVPASEDQFSLREQNGRYYGRGVFDMKFAIAAYLQLVDDLNGSLTDYNFGLMITSDEEVGGYNGTAKLIEAGYTANVVILPDVGDTPKYWKLERSAKGVLILEVKTRGKSAHGSRPWKGENAIDKLTTVLDEIRTLFKNQGPTTNTLTISTITGGDAINKIPSNASAHLDIRTVSDQDAASIRGSIAVLCKKHGAELNDMITYGSARPADNNNPYVAQFISCTQSVTKSEIEQEDSYGGSDARFFTEAGIPCIVAGPPGDGFHQTDEWVSKQGLDELLQVLHLYLKKVALPAQPNHNPAAAKKTLKAV